MSGFLEGRAGGRAEDAAELTSALCGEVERSRRFLLLPPLGCELLSVSNSSIEKGSYSLLRSSSFSGVGLSAAAEVDAVAAGVESAAAGALRKEGGDTDVASD